MSTLRNSLKTLVGLGMLAVAAIAAAQPKTTAGMVTDEKGMSLYVWGNDLAVPGKSMCTGPCSVTWPPVVAKEGSRPLTTMRC